MKEFPKIDKIKDEKFAFIKFERSHETIHETSEDTRRLRRYGPKKAEIPIYFLPGCKLVKDIGLDEVWPQADDQTKESASGSTCRRMLTSTVSAIPPKMLKNIETMARVRSPRTSRRTERTSIFLQMMKSVKRMI